MSTLRTNNLQSPDSAGVNIVMTEGGGAIFSGIVTAPTLNVTGVLTYDDVTNIDSVGIITARMVFMLLGVISNRGESVIRICHYRMQVHLYLISYGTIKHQIWTKHFH